MMTEPARFRPKAYPPPEFPPRKAAAFARTPPAIFPPILGLLGLGLAAKRALAGLNLPVGIADAALGALVMLWLAGVLTYLAKVARRPAVVAADLGSLPGRAGLAAATMGGMLLSAILAPFAPTVAVGLLWLSLSAHAALAGLLVRLLLKAAPEARSPNPTLHLSFVGFVVGGVGAAELGLPEIATALLYTTIPVALAIWAIAAVDLLRRVPPAPLRPLLAIHLAPACLLASVSALTGHAMLAQAFALLAAAIGLALLAASRWLLAGGVTPLWGALTFPLSACASAFLLAGWAWAGLAVLLVGLGLIPWIAWRVLSLWPGNRLAAKTNAAEA
jgi:tellurite resistance protein